MPELPESAPAPERKVFPFEALLPTGVLWLINRTVFHPRGLALAVSYADGDPAARGWELVASPDGSPYTYGGFDETEKLRAVEELIDLARLNGVMPPPLKAAGGDD